MVSTRKLSSDEVNALIEGLNDGSEAPVDQSNSVDVRPFKFGADELSLLGDYYALRLINERFARMARSVYLPMLRSCRVFRHFRRRSRPSMNTRRIWKTS